MPVRLSRSLSTALVGCALVGVGALASPASAGDLGGPDKAHHGGHGHAVIFPTRSSRPGPTLPPQRRQPPAPAR